MHIQGKEAKYALKQNIHLKEHLLIFKHLLQHPRGDQLLLASW